MDNVNYWIKYIFLGGIIGTTVYFGHVVYCLGSETLDSLKPVSAEVGKESTEIEKREVEKKEK